MVFFCVWRRVAAAARLGGRRVAAAARLRGRRVAVTPRLWGRRIIVKQQSVLKKNMQLTYAPQAKYFDVYIYMHIIWAPQAKNF